MSGLSTAYANPETSKKFEAHMNFLASDLLLGRDTGSTGHEIASEQFVAINRIIAEEVAIAKERPAWNKDSFFATIKEQ